MDLRLTGAIAEIAPSCWDKLASGHPFLRHAFLEAFEASGCAGPASGWTPRHLTLWDGDELAAAMPLYEKAHSFGEFVFDWAWAEAYQRAGMPYYPKLLCAVPFTPVQGARLLARDVAARQRLLEEGLKLAHDSGVSSWHVLFPTGEETALLAEHGLMIRRGVQFHWRNRGYRDVGDFLDTLTRDKRKKIRQERRRVSDAGVSAGAPDGRRHRAAALGVLLPLLLPHLPRPRAHALSEPRFLPAHRRGAAGQRPAGDRAARRVRPSPLP